MRQLHWEYIPPKPYCISSQIGFLVQELETKEIEILRNSKQRNSK